MISEIVDVYSVDSDQQSFETDIKQYNDNTFSVDDMDHNDCENPVLGVDYMILNHLFDYQEPVTNDEMDTIDTLNICSNFVDVTPIILKPGEIHTQSFVTDNLTEILFNKYAETLSELKKINSENVVLKDKLTSSESESASFNSSKIFELETKIKNLTTLCSQIAFERDNAFDCLNKMSLEAADAQSKLCQINSELSSAKAVIMRTTSALSIAQNTVSSLEKDCMSNSITKLHLDSCIADLQTQLAMADARIHLERMTLLGEERLKPRCLQLANVLLESFPTLFLSTSELSAQNWLGESTDEAFGKSLASLKARLRQSLPIQSSQILPKHYNSPINNLENVKNFEKNSYQLQNGSSLPKGSNSVNAHGMQSKLQTLQDEISPGSGTIYHILSSSSSTSFSNPDASTDKLSFASSSIFMKDSKHIDISEVSVAGNEGQEIINSGFYVDEATLNIFNSPVENDSRAASSSLSKHTKTINNQRQKKLDQHAKLNQSGQRQITHSNELNHVKNVSPSIGTLKNKDGVHSSHSLHPQNISKLNKKMLMPSSSSSSSLHSGHLISAKSLSSDSQQNSISAASLSAQAGRINTKRLHNLNPTSKFTVKNTTSAIMIPVMNSESIGDIKKDSSPEKLAPSTFKNSHITDDMDGSPGLLASMTESEQLQGKSDICLNKTETQESIRVGCTTDDVVHDLRFPSIEMAQKKDKISNDYFHGSSLQNQNSNLYSSENSAANTSNVNRINLKNASSHGTQSSINKSIESKRMSRMTLHTFFPSTTALSPTNKLSRNQFGSSLTSLNSSLSSLSTKKENQTNNHNTVTSRQSMKAIPSQINTQVSPVSYPNSTIRNSNDPQQNGYLMGKSPTHYHSVDQEITLLPLSLSGDFVEDKKSRMAAESIITTHSIEGHFNPPTRHSLNPMGPNPTSTFFSSGMSNNSEERVPNFDDHANSANLSPSNDRKKQQGKIINSMNQNFKDGDKKRNVMKSKLSTNVGVKNPKNFSGGDSDTSGMKESNFSSASNANGKSINKKDKGGVKNIVSSSLVSTSVSAVSSSNRSSNNFEKKKLKNIGKSNLVASNNTNISKSTTIKSKIPDNPAHLNPLTPSFIDANLDTPIIVSSNTISTSNDQTINNSDQLLNIKGNNHTNIYSDQTQFDMQQQQQQMIFLNNGLSPNINVSTHPLCLPYKSIKLEQTLQQHQQPEILYQHISGVSPLHPPFNHSMIMPPNQRLNITGGQSVTATNSSKMTTPVFATLNCTKEGLSPLPRPTTMNRTSISPPPPLPSGMSLAAGRSAVKLPPPVSKVNPFQSAYLDISSSGSSVETISLNLGLRLSPKSQHKQQNMSSMHAVSTTRTILTPTFLN